MPPPASDQGCPRHPHDRPRVSPPTSAPQCKVCDPACLPLKLPPPPQCKVYDLANLSLKFDRHLDAEIVDFQLLGDDYSKACFLCADRSLGIHARFGSYFKVGPPPPPLPPAYPSFKP